VLNLAYDTEGKWRSIESIFLYNHKMLAGAFFRASLAHYLQANLGLNIVIEGTAFEIDGVPTNLRKALSTRREQIKERLAQVGLHTAAAAAVATLETRKKKDHTQSLPDLLNRWRTIAAQHGFTLERARGLLYRVRPDQDPRAISQTVENAVRSLTHKSMQFSRQDLERKALQAAVEKGQHPSNVLSAVDSRLKQGPDVVKLTRDHRDQRYTTPEAKALRVDISQAVRRMDTSKAHPVSQRKIDETIRHFSTPRRYLTEELKHHVREIARAATHQETRPIDRETVARHAKQTLDTEQAQAVRDILASPGRISVLRHKAVADTDQVLRACRKAWESAGLEVIGASLSNADVERLERETSIETFSLKGLEVRMSPTLGYRLRHHARQFRRAAQGRTTYALDPLKIDRNKVLVIDHAERISPDQMAFLTKYVAKQGGKLVLVEGDRHYKKGLAPTAFDDLRKDLKTLRSDPSHPIDNSITAELDRIVKRPSTARQILNGL